MVNGLGKRLQEQRLLRKLSQKEVAVTLGVSPSVISNYESGERTPSVEVLMSLARLYRCSTDYFLGFGTHQPHSFIDTSMLTDEQIQLLSAFLDSLANK